MVTVNEIMLGHVEVVDGTKLDVLQILLAQRPKGVADILKQIFFLNQFFLQVRRISFREGRVERGGNRRSTRDEARV